MLQAAQDFHFQTGGYLSEDSARIYDIQVETLFMGAAAPMRRTALRDGDGTLHIVPNGAIQIVSNMTRDWSQVTLHVAADYSENSDRVVDLLKEVAKEFYNDSAFKDDLVAEPQVPGIERVRGQEVDYLMLVKVRPDKQYGVARELRRRIKACLEKNKIKAGAPVQVVVGQLPGS